VETPQQNVAVERKHQHILNVAPGLMFQSNLPKAYWTYVIAHVVHLINRLPTPVLKNKCPYEIIHDDPPTLLDLKVFGCLCFASTMENSRTKFDSRVRKGIFIGYKTGVKDYIILDIETREIFINRNVIFYENVFPYRTNEAKTQPVIDNNVEFAYNSIYDCINAKNNTTSITQIDSNVHFEHNSACTAEQRDPVGVTIEADGDHAQIRRSDRAKRIPDYLKDYHHQVNYSNSDHNPTHFKNTLKTPYPLSTILSYHSLSPNQLNFTLVISSTNELQLMMKLALNLNGSRQWKVKFKLYNSIRLGS